MRIITLVALLALLACAHAQDTDDTACLNTSYPCSNTSFGNILLVIFYGLLLCAGAKLISDGGELLLEVASPGIVGGIVLPVLGAVPDCAVIIASGVAASGPALAESLSVGVGTLAGSTVFLLTVPWVGSLILGRCDIDPATGESMDKTLKNGFSLTTTGVTVDDNTRFTSKLMILTSLGYLLIQGVAFAYLNDPVSAPTHERGFALATMILCILGLVGYCGYQVWDSKRQEEIQRRKQKAKEEALREMIMQKYRALILKAFAPKPAAAPASEPSAGSPLLAEQRALNMGLRWKSAALNKNKSAVPAPQADVEKNIQGDDDEEEEEHSNDPAYIIALKSAGLLAVGVAFVSVFSDPIVDVLTKLGSLWNIKPFYLSFIVTPLCSNASETISSLVFASRKKKTNSSVTYSQLYGAACMNATMCLGIFVALIYFKQLAWTFSAEVVCILVVTWSVGFIASRTNTYKLYVGLIVLCMYPIGLAVVAILENAVGWQ